MQPATRQSAILFLAISAGEDLLYVFKPALTGRTARTNRQEPAPGRSAGGQRLDPAPGHRDYLQGFDQGLTARLSPQRRRLWGRLGKVTFLWRSPARPGGGAAPFPRLQLWLRLLVPAGHRMRSALGHLPCEEAGRMSAVAAAQTSKARESSDGWRGRTTAGCVVDRKISARLV